MRHRTPGRERTGTAPIMEKAQNEFMTEARGAMVRTAWHALAAYFRPYPEISVAVLLRGFDRNEMRTGRTTFANRTHSANIPNASPLSRFTPEWHSGNSDAHAFSPSTLYTFAPSVHTVAALEKVHFHKANCDCLQNTHTQTSIPINTNSWYSPTVRTILRRNFATLPSTLCRAPHNNQSMLAPNCCTAMCELYKSTRQFQRSIGSHIYDMSNAIMECVRARKPIHA